MTANTFVNQSVLHFFKDMLVLLDGILKMQLFQINQSEDSSKITIMSDTTCVQLHQRPITTASLYHKFSLIPLMTGRRAWVPLLRVRRGRVRGDQGRQGARQTRRGQGIRGAGHPVQLQEDGLDKGDDR